MRYEKKWTAAEKMMIILSVVFLTFIIGTFAIKYAEVKAVRDFNRVYNMVYSVEE